MSTALAYHDATKYRPETIGQQAPIDWERQPVPFKDYASSEAVELAAWLPFDPNPFTGAPRTAEALEAPLALNRPALSRLLFCAYGITGMLEGERPTYLRAAPSAGGLYPAELYVVSLGSDVLPAGLYGYDPRHHHLVPLALGTEQHAAVAAACYGNAAVAAAPILLITSGVFWRSAWRYGERAYRRVLLDTGHLLGNAALAAAGLGLRCHLTTAFCDERLNRVLRIEADTEAALAVLAVNLPGPSERPAWSCLPSPVGSAEASTLVDVHRTGSLAAQRPALIARGEQQADAVESGFGSLAGPPLAAEHLRSRLSTDLIGAILHRRSTRRFVRGAIERAHMERVLACGSAPEAAGLGEQPVIERDLLRTFVAVAAVDGLEPGVYYYAPHSRELRLVRAGLRRDALHFICLGQELGRDAAFAVFHTADLAQAVRRHGDRVYRAAHLEAGLVGERLNLGALAEGLGVSGIGGFFDDHAAHLLGLPPAQAIIYITVVGMAADRDGR